MNNQELENLLEEALQSVQQNIPSMANTFRQHGFGTLANPTTTPSTLHIHQDISGSSLTDVITDMSANPALIPRVEVTPQTEHTSTSSTASPDNHTDDITMIQYAAINSFFEYQENIRMYQQNVRSFLRVVDTMVSGNTTRRTSTPRFLRRPTSFPSFVTNLPERLFQHGSGVGSGVGAGMGAGTGAGAGSGQNVLSFEFQTRPFLFSSPEVPPIPTLEQYTQSTEALVFNSSNVSQLHSLTCPITLEDFQHGELLCRIKHCNHIFKEAALRNWFLQNSHCPVCRHDIRENPMSSSSNLPTTG